MLTLASNLVKPIIALTVVGAILFGAFAYKDSRVASKISAYEEQLKQKDREISKLLGERKVKEDLANEAVARYEDLKKTAADSAKKTDSLGPIPKPPVTTVSEAYSQECIDSLNALQEQWEARESVIMVEITDLRILVTQADITINKLKDVVATDTKVISSFQEKDKLSEKTIATLSKEVATQESRKKVYRTTSGILVIIVIILL